MSDQPLGGGATGGDGGGAAGGRAGASDSRPVAEVMTTQVVTVPSDAPVAEAARLMREHDIGPVVVVEGDQVRGIVTDRDITIRAVAEGRDVQSTPVSEVASQGVTTVSPDDTIDLAAETMRAEALRRVVAAAPSASSPSVTWPRTTLPPTTQASPSATSAPLHRRTSPPGRRGERAFATMARCGGSSPMTTAARGRSSPRRSSSTATSA